MGRKPSLFAPQRLDQQWEPNATFPRGVWRRRFPKGPFPRCRRIPPGPISHLIWFTVARSRAEQPVTSPQQTPQSCPHDLPLEMSPCPSSGKTTKESLSREGRFPSSSAHALYHLRPKLPSVRFGVVRHRILTSSPPLVFPLPDPNGRSGEATTILTQGNQAFL